MQTTETNPIVQIASKYINNTNCNIYLTGKAGTGKTTFLRNITQYTHKNVVVAAPTGVAAINAAGVTLHSLFHLPFGSFIPSDGPIQGMVNFQLNTPKSLMSNLKMNKQKRGLLRELELLIIDEVSMLRADILDAIDTILRSVRRNRNQAFGGVQMLFIGDLLQLPPIVKNVEQEILSQFYPSAYFFHAQVLQCNKPIYIELEKVYRQTDGQFVEILNHLRENRLTEQDAEKLNAYYKPNVQLEKLKGYVHLTTHNHLADKTNSDALNRLDGKTFAYTAEIEGEFNENQYPIDYELTLKENAQVMFVKNDYSGKSQYFNGKIGTVCELDDTFIKVRFEDGDIANVEPYTWENKKYRLNPDTNTIDENLLGKFVQYPLKLAWAITVHKSQGLTFEKAILDVGRSFAPGQIYVALSRLTSLKGLVLLSPISTDLLPQDASISSFTENKLALNELKESLEPYSKKYIGDAMLNTFSFDKLFYGFKNHVDSYDKDATKSVKQSYRGWATKRLQNIQELQSVARKFQNQIQRMLLDESTATPQALQERCISAKNYFEPKINEVIQIVSNHYKNLSSQKRIKTYLNEIRDLERLLTSQLQNITKTGALIESILNNTELSRNDLKGYEVFKQIEPIPHKPLKNKKQKAEKADKGPGTKEITYKMYKEGKTIADIAKERSLTEGTIEGHFAHYVESGEVAVTEFIEKERLDKIIHAAEEMDTTSLSDLRSTLGNDFGWGELKIAVAHYIKTLQKDQ